MTQLSITPPTHRRSAEHGQILVVFAITLLTLLAFTGLALDGGSAFVQRRDQQAAADLAALAAANDYLVNQSEDLATARAREVAAANGYAHLVNDAVVNVSYDTSNGIGVTVRVDSLHRNAVLGVVGMPSWAISAKAAAQAGFPDTGAGAAPFIFSANAFASDGTPLYQTPTNFGGINGDAPVGATDMAWTNWGTGNLNTTEADQIIRGQRVVNKTLRFGEYIGQENSGNHTALFEDVNTYLAGQDLPVAVVDDNGNFVGWATFHVISASGSSNKHIRGYFVSSFESARLSIGACAANDCPRYLGSYVLKLVD